MAKLNTLKAVERPQSVVVYGPSKSGKTQLVAALAKAGYNLLWFDLESGLQTILSSLSDEELERVEYLRIPDTADNPVAIRTMGMVFSGAAGSVCEDHGEWKCARCTRDGKPVVQVCLNDLDATWVVVVDSTTQLSDSALAHATRGMKERVLTAEPGKAPKVEWDHYNHQGMLLSYVFSSMQQGRYHRVFISHEECIEQVDEKELIMPKCGTRNYSRQFARFFDHVVYCYRNNNTHKQASSTAFRANVLTGSRSSVSMESGASLADVLRGVQPEPAAKPAVPASSKNAALLAKLKK